MDALRIAAPPFGTSSGGFDLGLRSGAKRLTKDSFIIPVLHTPDFPSALTLDYFASDGSVSHLAFAAPSGLLQPGRTLSIGDPHPDDPAANLTSVGTPGWQVDAPYGTDLIVAIASDQKLFAKARPEGERPEDYVKALRAELEADMRRGGRVALAVVPVETAER